MAGFWDTVGRITSSVAGRVVTRGAGVLQVLGVANTLNNIRNDWNNGDHIAAIGRAAGLATGAVLAVGAVVMTLPAVATAVGVSAATAATIATGMVIASAVLPPVMEVIGEEIQNIRNNGLGPNTAAPTPAGDDRVSSAAPASPARYSAVDTTRLTAAEPPAVPAQTVAAAEPNEQPAAQLQTAPRSTPAIRPA